MLVKMVSPAGIELWAQGLGETKGPLAHGPERVTANFVMRAAGRFLGRCGKL